jgi:hypothetical protein
MSQEPRSYRETTKTDVPTSVSQVQVRARTSISILSIMHLAVQVSFQLTGQRPPKDAKGASNK